MPVPATQWKFCHQSRQFLCEKQSTKRTPKSLGLWVWFSSRNCCVQIYLLQGINLPPDQQLLQLRRIRPIYTGNMETCPGKHRHGQKSPAERDFFNLLPPNEDIPNVSKLNTFLFTLGTFLRPFCLFQKDSSFPCWQTLF